MAFLLTREEGWHAYLLEGWHAYLLGGRGGMLTY